ncbi:unnamed protein product [Scytosiphon promiscuus]
MEMAAAARGRQSRTPCFFYEKGSCRSGASCRFAHGASDNQEAIGNPSTGEAGRAPAPERPSMAPPSSKNKKAVCKYFAKGTCTRGDACSFLHPAHNSGGSSTHSGSGTKVDPINIGEKRAEEPPLPSYVGGGGGVHKPGRAADLGSWADVVAAMDVDVDSTTTTVTTTPSSRSRSSSRSTRSHGGDASPHGAPFPKATSKRSEGAGGAAAAADGETGPREKSDNRPRSKETACVFFLRGRCRFGDSCKFSHDARKIEDGHGRDGSTDSGRKRGPDKDSQESARAAEEAALDEAERVQSRRAECGVCLERVRKVKGAENRMFGILTGCKHVYCLGCINEWRDKSKSHECPECRMPSTWVLPSKTLVTDPARKKRLALEFHKSLGGNPPPRRRHRVA